MDKQHISSKPMCAEEQAHNAAVGAFFANPQARHRHLSELAQTAREINMNATSKDILVSDPSRGNKKFAS